MDFIQGKCHVQCLGRNSPQATTQAGGDWWRSSYAERALSQQCIITAKKENRPLGCIRQSLASRSTKVIPLLSPADTSTGYCNSLQYKRDEDTWERIQGKAIKTVRAHTALWDRTAWAGSLSMQGWRREALVYLQGGHGDDEVKLYNRGADTGHKLKPGRFRLDTRKNVPTMRRAVQH